MMTAASEATFSPDAAPLPEPPAGGKGTEPIRQLPPAVVSQIAAGEVIERPASAVKEMLENALDAGATRITVELAEGGRELIRLVDDGAGIAREQLPLAIAPHATSKLRTADDLFRIRTLGFRGEALASIAGVSELTLRSRPVNQAVGGQLETRFGHIVEQRECGCPVGTQIEVRNLFGNVPVRRKFLKSKQTELGHVTEAMTRLALAFPHLSLRLTHDGRAVLQRPAGLDRQASIAQLFGPKIADALLPIAAEVASLRLTGFAAAPRVDHNNATRQYLFVNGRFIRDRSLGHALSEAYRGLLLTGRYPIAFLFFEIPCEEVDCNVHPTKTEVRFRDPHQVYSLLLGALRTRFLAADLVSSLDPRKAAASGAIANGIKQGQDAPAASTSSLPAMALFEPATPTTDWSARRQAINEQFSLSGKPPETQPDLWKKTPTAEPLSSPSGHSPSEKNERTARPAWGQMPTPPSSAGYMAPETVAPPAKNEVAFSKEESPRAAPGPNPIATTLPERDGQTVEPARDTTAIGRGAQPAKFAPSDTLARVLQVHNSYLVVETADGLLVIDQHALHERILYEELRARVAARSLEVQPLLVPEVVELSPVQLGLVLEQQQTLAQMGIDIDQFGDRCLLVQSFPVLLGKTGPETVLQEIGALLEARGKLPSRDELLQELLHMAACKAAVKAGDPLTPEEADALVRRQHLVEDSHHCPHGRPTVLRFTLADLERQFKRT